VIVGGGPTGIETAGSLSELKKHVFPKDYPELNISRMMIHIIESAGKLLGAMSEKSAQGAERYIRKMGVNVYLNVRVTHYDGTTVMLSDGRTIAAKTLIWSAGVSGNMPEGIEPASIEKGRIVVDSFNRVRNHEHIFCIGDAAMMKDEKHPEGYPMLAPIAIQQGRHLAKNLMRQVDSQPMKPFHYFDKGVMATVGRNKALVDSGKIHIEGFIAWLGWLFVHLMYLVGYRNRVIVFINWLWSYINFDNSMRLVIRPFVRKKKDSEKN